MIREKNIPNLVLDLRSNDGGDPFCAAPLFSYLIAEPTPYFAEPYGKYAPLAEPVTPAENRFTGNLFTLIDGRCFSTNGHFCALLKYHGIGQLVGTPSGGTYTCNAGHNGIVHLTHSRFMLYFARSSFAAAVQGMDKSQPIWPDYLVQETYQDFLAGKDVYMEKVWALMRERKL